MQTDTTTIAFTRPHTALVVSDPFALFDVFVDDGAHLLNGPTFPAAGTKGTGFASTTRSGKPDEKATERRMAKRLKGRFIMNGKASGSARRMSVVVTVAIATAVLAGAASIVPAHATTGDLTCEASGQVNFSPALTRSNTSAIASVTSAFVNCISPNGQYQDLRSAAISGAGTVTSSGGLNPCSLSLTLETTSHITWSPTGQKSKSSGRVNTDLANGTLEAGTTITSGPLAGDKSRAVGAVVANADCAVNGLKSLTFVIGQEIFG